MVCEKCREETNVWYRVGETIVCPQCKGADDAKNTAEKKQEERETKQRQK